MLLRNGVDLKPFNTMALAAPAAHFVQAETDAQLREALLLAEREGWPVMVLGGGSNMILAGPVSGLVVRVASRGRRVLSR
ncbi:MAG TPA: UDP-N-acetylenolpyruvoylglucosamine reductase, partial [Pseudomonas sp.]|nr:UDP-N-acetylenolpyruvoylglucosamine reductase [Pseudomonas sp.]